MSILHGIVMCLYYMVYLYVYITWCSYMSILHGIVICLCHMV